MQMTDKLAIPLAFFSWSSLCALWYAAFSYVFDKKVDGIEADDRLGIYLMVFFLVEWCHYFINYWSGVHQLIYFILVAVLVEYGLKNVFFACAAAFTQGVLFMILASIIANRMATAFRSFLTREISKKKYDTKKSAYDVYRRVFQTQNGVPVRLAGETGSVFNPLTFRVYFNGFKFAVDTRNNPMNTVLFGTVCCRTISSVISLVLFICYIISSASPIVDFKSYRSMSMAFLTLFHFVNHLRYFLNWEFHFYSYWDVVIEIVLQSLYAKEVFGSTGFMKYFGIALGLYYAVCYGHDWVMMLLLCIFWEFDPEFSVILSFYYMLWIMYAIFMYMHVITDLPEFLGRDHGVQQDIQILLHFDPLRSKGILEKKSLAQIHTIRKEYRKKSSSENCWREFLACDDPEESKRKCSLWLFSIGVDAAYAFVISHHPAEFWDKADLDVSVNFLGGNSDFTSAYVGMFLAPIRGVLHSYSAELTKKPGEDPFWHGLQKAVDESLARYANRQITASIYGEFLHTLRKFAICHQGNVKKEQFIVAAALLTLGYTEDGSVKHMTEKLGYKPGVEGIFNLQQYDSKLKRLKSAKGKQSSSGNGRGGIHDPEPINGSQVISCAGAEESATQSKKKRKGSDEDGTRSNRPRLDGSAAAQNKEPAEDPVTQSNNKRKGRDEDGTRSKRPRLDGSAAAQNKKRNLKEIIKGFRDIARSID